METATRKGTTLCHNCLKPKAAHRKERGEATPYCPGPLGGEQWTPGPTAR